MWKGLLAPRSHGARGRKLKRRRNRSASPPEVAGALDYVYRHGIVHRDIKPENIMLQDGHAMVADFGIGKAVSDLADHAPTQAGTSLGTPAYMSPEQAAGETVDGRSDLYSLGCVLYEMLVGETRRSRGRTSRVIAKRFVQTPADVTALREGIPRPVARARAAGARSPSPWIATTPCGALRDVAHRRRTWRQLTNENRADERSLAVLPFANMSGDPDNEFFADGITEEILNELAQSAELAVAGRTSSFSFKGKNHDIRRSRNAHLGNVLEGSVRRDGEQRAHHRPAHRRGGRIPAVVGTVRSRHHRRVRGAGRDRLHHRGEAEDDPGRGRWCWPSARPTASRRTKRT